MALLLDTNVLIRAERNNRDLLELLHEIQAKTAEVRLGISVVTLMELAHGQQRAPYGRLADDRGLFISILQASLSVSEIALRAGKLDGLLEMNGITIGFPDLLIAATAVEHGFGLLTENLKHFTHVPWLRVVDASTLFAP